MIFSSYFIQSEVLYSYVLQIALEYKLEHFMANFFACKSVYFILYNF